MTVRSCRLRDTQTFHAGKTCAIGEGKGLVIVLQHPLSRFRKKVWTDPSEVDGVSLPLRFLVYGYKHRSWFDIITVTVTIIL